MLRPGLEFGGRFRVLQNFAAAANSIALAEQLSDGRRIWLVLLAIAASATEIEAALEQYGRFALGVPGLARPLTSGIDGAFGFVAFAAPNSGSVAEAHLAPWEAVRVAALARRVALALGPLHDQGIAHGCMRPELLAESDPSDVLFGFGVAALATRFGAPGEASQLLAPDYRAPELRNALLAPTPLSDMYALGVVLRELLLPPERAESGALRVPGTLPLALEAVLAHATAPEPRARLADVRVLAAELERLAEPARLAESGRPAEPALLPKSAVEERPTPAPPAAPFASAPPRAFVPAPPFASAPARDSSRGAMLVALFVVLGGFLLMIGVVTGAFVFAVHHARRVRISVSAPVHHFPPVVLGPRPTTPGPSDDDLPPLPPSAHGPPKKSASARPALSHALLVPPGVGPSTFPEDARAALPVSGTEPIWGTRRAPLTWVLFGDLDCPFTRRAWRALEAAKVTFGDDLRIVFRHRPLREHPYALRAARVLAGLERQRGPAAFFAVLHRVAQNEAGLTDEKLAAALNAAGYGNVQLSELAFAGEHVVEADLALAGQFAVSSTPLSFVNGMRVDGERSPGELDRILLDERRSATWVLATGAAAKDLYATRTNSNLIGLGEQDTLRVCAPIAGSPTRGPADALVTLVEFADFECPYCKQVEPTLVALLARYPRTLRLVWKDFPLPQHRNARLLANFAADAGSRGSNAGFWTVHDGLFASASGADDGVLGEVAGKAGLDGALLLIAAHAGVHDSAIRADVGLGERLGVDGTPTFFANGRRIQGALSLDQFDARIRAELTSARRIVARGVAPEKLYRLVCDAED